MHSTGLCRQRIATTRAVIAVVAVAVPALSCRRREPDRYCDEASGFSMRLPPGWPSERGFAEKVLVLEEDPLDPAGANITVYAWNLHRLMSLEDYGRRRRQIMTRMVAGFSEVESGDAEIDGRRAKWIVYASGRRQAQAGEQARRLHLHFLIVSGETGYEIDCSAPAGKLDRYRATFEDTAASFSLQ